MDHPISNPERRAQIVHRHSWEERMGRILDEAS